MSERSSQGSSRSKKKRSPDPSVSSFVRNEGLSKDNISDSMRFVYDAQCVRKKANWSVLHNELKFDHPEFDREAFQRAIPTHSPKLEALLKKIKDLDAEDMAKDGVNYKHFIFSDVKMNGYGAKMITSALLAEGMQLGYESHLLGSYETVRESLAKEEEILGGSEFPEEQEEEEKEKKEPKYKFSKIALKSEDELKQSQHFFLLSSINVYGQSITSTLKKKILGLFNKRPDNVYGDLARFIIMDSGYKEGIDLFDIKYVHIFEPPTSKADQKQVIGRGTRTCGQKGLQFHPTQGWPLHVFIYDVDIPEKYAKDFMESTSLFDLYMKAMNLDLRLYQFQTDLERVAVMGSVDYDLNRGIHHFSTGSVEKDVILGGAMVRRPGDPRPRPEKVNISVVLPKKSYASVVKHGNLPEILTSGHDKRHEALQAYIKSHFSQYEWKNIKMENLCGQQGGTNSVMVQHKQAQNNFMQLTPTQDFIRSFFKPELPLKGMLLWHSVGTGKTCTAIALASDDFERQGYTVLWTTRTTLKSDIWKNMFDQICSQSLRQRMVAEGLVIPEDATERKRLLPVNWSIPPMSYKQLSNLVNKKNKLYEDMVRRNGAEDPLRKTLLIIDEAHKLYGGGDLSSIERPDMGSLEKAIQHSYRVSGANSVRVLLMTATPITESPMEMIQLVNLLKPSQERIPDQFEEFAERFLEPTGLFTQQGEKAFLNAIAGNISYLNREKDARQFAQPVVHYVHVPLVRDENEFMKYDAKYVRHLENSEVIKLQKEVQEHRRLVEMKYRVSKADFADLKKGCEEFPPGSKQKKACVAQADKAIKEAMESKAREKKQAEAEIKKMEERIQQRKQSNKQVIEEIKQVDPEELKQYKKTMFYNVKEECATPVSVDNLAMFLEKHPDVQVLDRRIQEFQVKWQETRDQADIQAKTIRLRIQEINKTLKRRQPDDVARQLEVEKRNLKREYKENRENTGGSIEGMAKDIKEEEKNRAKLLGKLRRSIKKYFSKDERERQKQERDEYKLRLEREKLQEQNERLREDKQVRIRQAVQADIQNRGAEVAKRLAEAAAKEAQAIKAQEKADENRRKQEEREQTKAAKAAKEAEAKTQAMATKSAADQIRAEAAAAKAEEKRLAKEEAAAKAEEAFQQKRQQQAEQSMFAQEDKAAKTIRAQEHKALVDQVREQERVAKANEKDRKRLEEQERKRLAKVEKATSRKTKKKKTPSPIQPLVAPRLSPLQEEMSVPVNEEPIDLPSRRSAPPSFVKIASTSTPQSDFQTSASPASFVQTVNEPLVIEPDPTETPSVRSPSKRSSKQSRSPSVRPLSKQSSKRYRSPSVRSLSKQSSKRSRMSPPPEQILHLPAVSLKENDISPDSTILPSVRLSSKSAEPLSEKRESMIPYPKESLAFLKPDPSPFLNASPEVVPERLSTKGVKPIMRLNRVFSNKQPKEMPYQIPMRISASIRSPPSQRRTSRSPQGIEMVSLRRSRRQNRSPSTRNSNTTSPPTPKSVRNSPTAQPFIRKTEAEPKSESHSMAQYNFFPRSQTILPP